MRLPTGLLAILLSLALASEPAAAQEILRDAETEAFFHDMARPLIVATGLDPKNVDVALVNDPEVNAFVAGGQVVYVNSGLINMADNANEVQGVVAHELGHVVGGHAINTTGESMATHISILSLLLGGLAAAAGGGEAAMGIFMAGQQAAIGKYLAFTRGEEASADAAGASFLSKAGISGKGSIAFFEKLQNMEYRYGYNARADDQFMMTHPVTPDRITTLQDVYEKDPAWNKPNNAQLEERFQLIKAKLFGYLAEPKDTFKVYPVTDSSLPAHYARAYAYHKDAQLDRAIAETDALLLAEPQDPYFLELRGQILLEAGQPKEALESLRRATTMTGNQPLIATTFGHALVATEDPSNYPEALKVLKAAVARDRENPFAWYELGTVYAAMGDIPRAQLASAEQQSLNGQWESALHSANAAELSLPQGTPDWLRAQDIAFAARAKTEHTKKHK